MRAAESSDDLWACPLLYLPGLRVRVSFASGIYALSDLARLALDGRVGVILCGESGPSGTPIYRVRIGEWEVWAREDELAPADYAYARPHPTDV
jgi:hypothetical protein